MHEREEGPLEVLILNWRDQTHPQGGGSEVFAETVAAGLSRLGHRVTIFCAAHEEAPSETRTTDGVRIVRAGGRLSVYSAAAISFWRGRLGRPDVIVDVQNGLPFLAQLWARTPVVLVCHHVHREQWAVVLGPRAARFGWWVESRLSPRVHRGNRYVTVSDVSRRELAELGVAPEAVHVVHNGVDVPHDAVAPRSETPLLVVLGRLVPHKRVELALDTVAALRDEFPGLRLVVAGRGWWHDEIVEHRDRLGLSEHDVLLEGWVDEDEKDRLLSSAWVSLVPSLKEGWGIAVMEAAAHGTPSIAFRDAGGVAESIVDGETGTLVDSVEEFIDATRTLLRDGALRESYAARAREHARTYSWDSAVADLEKILLDEAARPLGTEHPRASARERRPHVVVDDRADKARAIVDIVSARRDLAGARILDAGCGSGAIASELARAAGPDATVVAVDRLDVRSTHSDHAFARADGGQLPFADSSFDVVVSNHVLEHVGSPADQLHYLTELARVVRGDGVVYLAVPNRFRLVEAHYRLPLLSWIPQRGADAAVRATRRGDWYDVDPPSRSELRSLVRRAGLEADDVTGTVARQHLHRSGAPGRLATKLPEAVLDAALAVVPTFVLVCRPLGRIQH